MKIKTVQYLIVLTVLAILATFLWPTLNVGNKITVGVASIIGLVILGSIISESRWYQRTKENYRAYLNQQRVAEYAHDQILQLHNRIDNLHNNINQESHTWRHNQREIERRLHAIESRRQTAQTQIDPVAIAAAINALATLIKGQGAPPIVPPVTPEPKPAATNPPAPDKLPVATAANS